MLLSENEIVDRLAQSYDSDQPPECPYPLQESNGPPRSAAVLIPFLEIDDRWHLLLIKRSLNPHDPHGGQVAFPGGRRIPPDDSIQSVALREAEEEIGLSPGDVHIWGRIRDLMTITNYRVSPFVGKMPWPYPVVPQKAEVSRIFHLPLAWLADRKNRETHRRSLRYHGEPIPVIYFQPYQGETLWGASARMTMLLLEALGLSEPEGRYA
jgi:8-oxo-dGTP pyrophosphatase MutT (NUDIX family)